MTRSKRPLSGDETALWEQVASTAKPLRPAKPAVTAAPPSPPAKEERPLPKPAESPRLPQRQPGGIDRRSARRIARGAIAIDARLDLHGMTQAEAHERLHRFLAAAQADDRRLVLVITGKGGYGEGDRGVLRRSVPLWLAAPRFRALVSGFGEAHRAHGGAGAWYVRLKRA